MAIYTALRLVPFMLLIFQNLVTQASFSPEKKNFDHIMHLYNGLLKHNNSDIVIAVDSAEGIKEYVFNGMRNLTEKAVQCLKHVRKTRIAVVSFAEQAKVIHRLDDCQKEDCIVNALRSLRMSKGKRATMRAMKEAKRLLKNGGRKKAKWTVVIITFGAPRIGRKKTVKVAERLKRFGTDMFVLAVGKKAFNNYATLKTIVRPFEIAKHKRRQRLFLFRGPQHKSDFMMTKAVLNIVCARRNKRNLLSTLRILGRGIGR